MTARHDRDRDAPRRLRSRLTRQLAGLVATALVSTPAVALVVTPGGVYMESVEASTGFQIIDRHGPISSADTPRGVLQDGASRRTLDTPVIQGGTRGDGIRQPDIGVSAQVAHSATARFQGVPDRMVDARASALSSADTGRLRVSTQASLVDQTRGWPDPASFEMVMGLSSARAILFAAYRLTVTRALAEAIAAGTAAAPLTAHVTLSGTIERAPQSSGATTNRPDVTLDILGFTTFADTGSHLRQAITIDTEGSFSQTFLATAGRFDLDRYGPFGAPGVDCLEAAGIPSLGWVECTVSGGFQLELRSRGNWGLAQARVDARWSAAPGVQAVAGSIARWGMPLDARLLTPIPEPTSALLFGVGAGVVVLGRMRAVAGRRGRSAVNSRSRSARGRPRSASRRGSRTTRP